MAKTSNQYSQLQLRTWPKALDTFIRISNTINHLFHYLFQSCFEFLIIHWSHLIFRPKTMKFLRLILLYISTNVSIIWVTDLVRNLIHSAWNSCIFLRTNLYLFGLDWFETTLNDRISWTNLNFLFFVFQSSFFVH